MPDLSHDPAQQSLVNALRAGFKVLAVSMVVLVVAYVLTGFMSVGPGEQGLIVRFGRLVEQPDGGVTVKPGVKFALPEPFDEKIIIPASAQTRTITTFVFDRNVADLGKPLAEVFPKNATLTASDGAMLTGDQNLSHGIWQLEYRIRDAEAFLRHVSSAEGISEKDDVQRSATRFDALVIRLLEHAIVRETAFRRVEEVGGAGKAAFVAGVKDRLQKSLDRFNIGVVVDKVAAEIVYPYQVRDAFNEVTTAENNAKKEIESARQEATRTLTTAAGTEYEQLTAAITAYGAAQASNVPEAELAQHRARIDGLLENAGGEAAGILSSAAQRADAIRDIAAQEIARFQSWLELYRRDPQMTVTRIWNDMRAAVLDSKANELFFVPGVGALEIWTNRDLAKLLEAERERYEGAQRGGDAH